MIRCDVFHLLTNDLCFSGLLGTALSDNLGLVPPSALSTATPFPNMVVGLAIVSVGS